MSGPVWRFVVDAEPREGAVQMAIDAALLDGAVAGASPPTLRLYRWARPTASLGYAQRVDEAFTRRAEAAGVAVVRRPTGGRLVLHAGDVTYAVTGGGFPERVSEAYARIAEALAAALDALGLATALAPGALPPGRPLGCFASATRADLQLPDGRKLVGSAQARRAGALLQHGVVYRRYDAALAERLGLEPAPIADLEGLLGAAPSFEAIAGAFKAGFESAWGIRLEPGGLTSAEWRR